MSHRPGILAFLLATTFGCHEVDSGPARESTTSPEQGAGARPAPAAGCKLVEQDHGPEGTPALRAETVVSGLEVPWAIGFLPGGDMLVSERPGRIRLVRQGRLVPEPVATIETTAAAEGGLLGLALHPDFARSRWFYIYYTAGTGGRSVNRVERWRLADDGLRASRDRVVLDGIPAARFHDGGRLRFGPDGKLYVGTGDAGEPSRAQDRGSLAGKILRLTDDGRVPEDNPWPGNPAYVTGIRNTQGFDWDEGGTLYVSDHGPSGELGRRGHDEVSVVRSAGANLGWPTVYGCRTHAGLQAPVLSWREAAPPGGAVLYRGGGIPEWKGDLLVATLGSKHLHRVRFDGEGRLAGHEVYLRGDPPGGLGRLREITVGPDGALYVTTSNCDGRGRCPSEKDKVVRITK